MTRMMDWPEPVTWVNPAHFNRSQLLDPDWDSIEEGNQFYRSVQRHHYLAEEESDD